MNTKRHLTHAAMAAVLILAAPAYSQVLGGNAAGALGGTLGGGLRGVTGSGHAMGDATLGGTFDTDAMSRVGRRADGAGNRIRHGADGVRSGIGHGVNGAVGGTRNATDDIKSNATASTLPIAPVQAADRNTVPATPVEAADWNTVAAAPVEAADSSTTEPSSSNSASAPTEQPKRALDAGANLNGSANATALRDSTQPGGRRLDASASAEANASPSRR